MIPMTQERETRPVLVVEDDVDIRTVLGELLEISGYPVVLASSGSEALDHLRTTKQLPGAILLDLMMPVMNGWEFCAEQQKHAEWAEIPVVVISASDRNRTNLDGIKIHAYLRKPLEIDSIRKLLGDIYTSATA
jgi:CheY-like chemotaxis protein